MTAMELHRPAQAHIMPLDYSNEQIELIKNTVAAGTSDLEFAMFMEVSRTLGLSPLQKQIHAVMRWYSRAKKEKMVIQTGIDGYRLIAARTGAHLGTTDPVYGPANKQGFPEWAQVTTRRLVQGHIAEFPATAFWDEYVQTTKDGGPNSMWKGRPKGQLGKCAEALSLRKAFPAELSGVYSDIEMQQADSEPAQPQQARTVDVTREVAQAAGVPVQVNTDSDPDKLHQWRQKLKETCEKLSTYEGGKAAAIAELKLHAWENSVVASNSAYEALKRIGVELKAKQEAEVAQLNQAAQLRGIDEPVESEALITSEQLKSLQTAYGSRLKFSTPGDRHGFATWFLSLPARLNSTNALTEDQAAVLLDTLGTWDASAVEQTLTEFRRWQTTQAPF